MNPLKMVKAVLLLDTYINKIEDLEKRILEIEKESKLIDKSIKDNEVKIEKLEEEVKKVTISSAKSEATLDTLKLLAKSKRESYSEDNYEHTDPKRIRDSNT